MGVQVAVEAESEEKKKKKPGEKCTRDSRCRLKLEKRLFHIELAVPVFHTRRAHSLTRTRALYRVDRNSLRIYRVSSRKMRPN